MSLPSRQLFLDRFMAYNLIRYKNDPEILARLKKLTLDDIVFEGMSEDPRRPEGMVSNFSVPTDAIQAYTQRWIPVDIKSKHIIPPAEIIPSTSMADIIANNVRGLFSYKETDGTVKLAIVMSYRSDIPVQDLAREVARFLNDKSAYRLLSTDMQINLNASTDAYKVFDIRNETITGEVAVIRLGNGYLRGTPWLGYYGEWSAQDLISGSMLAQMVGLGTDAIINPDSEWLKFQLEGRILYVAKRPIRNNVSYSMLRQLSIVNGERVVTIGEDTFKVRLLSGTDADDSEWNRLMYRVSVNDPTKTLWEEFSDDELGVNVKNKGEITISRSLSGDSYYGRGRYGITTIQPVSQATVATSTGWRPVLELVGVENLTTDPLVEVTSVQPVEPYVDSGPQSGDLLYSVGPIAAKTPTPTSLTSYSNEDFVFNLNRVMVRLGNGGNFADLTTVNYDAVFNPTSVKVVMAADVIAADKVSVSFDDFILATQGSRVVVDPAFLSGQSKTAESDGVVSAKPLKSQFDLLSVSGLGNINASDNVAGGVVNTTRFIQAQEFVIESIAFTGIELFVPETDYGDLFEEEAYNSNTTFMSF